GAELAAAGAPPPRLDLDAPAAALGHHAGHAAVLAQQRDGRRLVADRNAAPLGGGVERLEHLRPAAPDVQREPAPELELAVDLVGLPAEPRLQLHALPRHPAGGVQTAADQNPGGLGIGAAVGE